MKPVTFVVLALVVTLVFVIASVSVLGTPEDGARPLGDSVDAIMDQSFYCAMVQYWEMDAAKGIPPEERIGWPPFRGECK